MSGLASLDRAGHTVILLIVIASTVSSDVCGGQTVKAKSPAVRPIAYTLRIPDRHPYLTLTPADVACARERAAKFPWAQRAMQQLVSNADGESAKPLDKLPKQGDWTHRSVSQRLFQVALAHAMTGERRYAEWVRDVLLTYADMYPGLPLWRQRCKMLSASPLMEATWFVPLVQAYDLVADSDAFTDEQRRHVENDLLRAAMVCFKIDDFETDSRIKDLHYRCYNFQAWHISAIGLAGLAIGDRELVAYAVNSPYGFGHLIAHDIRDDGLFWERSITYHHFVVHALLPFTEAMMHCGADLYGVRVPNDRSKDEDCHYVNDRSDEPKSFRLMFESPVRAIFPDGSYIAMGDSGRGPLRADGSCLIAYHRYRSPVLEWMLRRNPPLLSSDVRCGRVGFLHYYRYRYRYEDVRLDGQPVAWERCDKTYLRQDDGSMLVDDRGERQGDRYLLNGTNLRNFRLEWTMTRLRDSGADDRAWVVFQVDARNPNTRTTFMLPSHLPEIGRAYRFKLEVSGGKARLFRDGEMVSPRPSEYLATPEWRYLVYDAPEMVAESGDDRVDAVWRDGGFANTGLHENGCTLFPSSGLAVLRQRAGDFTSDTNATAVALSYGPYGGGHGHPDKMSIVLYAQGRQWTPLVGSMPYESTWKAEWTSHTISHNTVIVGGSSQKPTGDRNPGWPADSHRDKVLGELDRFAPKQKRCVAHCDTAYDGVRLRRDVRLRGHCVIDVFDVEPIASKTPTEPRQHDYVLHVDGELAEDSMGLKACSGKLGVKCGYQHVERRKIGEIADMGALTFRAGDKALRIWVVPAAGGPMNVVVADGLTNSPDARMPMLVLRQRGPRARFVTVLEPVDPDHRLRAVRLDKGCIVLEDGTGRDRVELR